MKCYVDDDLDSNLLIRLAPKYGHEMVSPRKVGLRGARDSTHFAYAVRARLPIVSGNTADFEALDDLARALQGQHSGVLLVYSEGRGRVPFGAAHILRALTRLESRGVPLANTLVVLNQVR